MGSQQAQRKAKEYSLHALDWTQTFCMVQTTMVGAGLLSLPRVVAEKAGHSGWIAILIAGGISQLSLWLIILLMRRFDRLDLYDILRVLFGKLGGNVLGALFTIYCLIVTGAVCRTYIEVVQSWLFPTTSTPVFYLLFLFPVFYCASGGLRIIARFTVFTFFGTIWMILFLLGPMGNLHLDHYLPLFDTNLPDLFQATMSAFTSFVGFEMMLLYYPYIKHRETALVPASSGLWFTSGFVYLAVTLVSIGYYSQGQLQMLLMPILQIFEAVHIPLIERIEHIGIATWSMLILNTAACYIWAAARYFQQWTRFQAPGRIYWLMLPVSVLGFWPTDWVSMQVFEKWVGLLGIVVSVGLAPTLLLIAIVLRKKSKSGVVE